MNEQKMDEKSKKKGRLGKVFTAWLVIAALAGGALTATACKTDLTEEASRPLIYTVTFVDENGNILGTQEVEHGKNATPPNPGTREGMDFDGWSGNYTNVTGSRTITAVWKEKTSTNTNTNTNENNNTNTNSGTQTETNDNTPEPIVYHTVRFSYFDLRGNECYLEERVPHGGNITQLSPANMAMLPPGYVHVKFYAVKNVTEDITEAVSLYYSRDPIYFYINFYCQNADGSLTHLGERLANDKMPLKDMDAPKLADKDGFEFVWEVPPDWIAGATTNIWGRWREKTQEQGTGEPGVTPPEGTTPAQPEVEPTITAGMAADGTWDMSANQKNVPFSLLGNWDFALQLGLLELSGGGEFSSDGDGIMRGLQRYTTNLLQQSNYFKNAYGTLAAEYPNNSIFDAFEGMQTAYKSTLVNSTFAGLGQTAQTIHQNIDATLQSVLGADADRFIKVLKVYQAVNYYNKDIMLNGDVTPVQTALANAGMSPVSINEYGVIADGHTLLNTLRTELQTILNAKTTIGVANAANYKNITDLNGYLLNQIGEDFVQLMAMYENFKELGCTMETYDNYGTLEAQAETEKSGVFMAEGFNTQSLKDEARITKALAEFDPNKFNPAFTKGRSEKIV